ncbi:MAG: DUF3298 and DUF4163 domain-containing protein [Lachnospiraceae bacterium]|nr:DUF3298 and DUF4163 domain-containing protein [Lachnospiraceae bacterium]
MKKKLTNNGMMTGKKARIQGKAALLGKRRLMSIMLAAVIAISLIGCGKASDTADNAESNVEEEADTSQIAVEETAESADSAGAKTDNSTVSKKENDISGKTQSDEVTEAGDEKTSKVPEVIVMKKSYYESATDENYTTLVTGSFTMPLLSDESAEDFPELAKAMKEDADKEFKYFEDDVEKIKADALDELENDPEYFHGPYSVNQGVDVMRADEKVLSFFMPIDQYMGGAHGIYGFGYISYDVVTGKVLKLADVLTSVDDLPKILQAELEEQYADQLEMFNDLENDLARYVDGEGVEYKEDGDYTIGYTWALTDDHIEFYFGPYELAAYASGAQSVCLYYDEYPDLFVKDYLPDADSAGTLKAFTYMMVSEDVDGDGKNDEIGFEQTYNDDYTELTDVRFCIGEESVSLADEYGFPGFEGTTGYFYNSPDGKDYVYVVVPDYNDYIRLVVFDITGGTIDKIYEEYFAGSFIAFDNEAGTYTEFIKYDPNNLKLATRFNQICTFSGYKSYHIGSDGKPVSDDEVYRIMNEATYEPITSVMDVECDFIDEKGNVTSTENVKAGETFKLLCTDGKSYIDAQLSDGRIVRLYVSGEGGDVVVNGIPGMDLFKDLMYAG